ncbi:ABC transporter substrate-binding protein [Pontibacter vulgaris]|uniref:ABC transporter substrate-binding protein n=1 Tax=Pontibacter vulgaris TaxID=2905679 RepID=UPI001FA7104C|nr:ABC transporter substrate-binding protein [Pontibacter vulgaris]
MKRSFLKHAAAWFIVGALAFPAKAQQNNEVKYSNGKILLEQQRYDLAMAEFLPLTNAAANSDYAPEASYLYALAALKANKLQEANQMLSQLKAQHPQWAGIAEADYLLANVWFERGEYEKALSILDGIKSDNLSSDADGLKRYYLNRLNDRPTFEKLLQRFENDKAVAQVYADKLVSGWYRPQDQARLESIVDKHKLDRKRYLSKDALKKQGYNVAVLMPFNLNQDMVQTARKNQFVTDLYAGMKLAQDSLQKQGLNINLFAYDTGTDTTGVRKVLSAPELKQMDMIIGPIYKSSAKMAAKFATATNIPVINPLSQDLSITNKSDNVFLFESSVATQAKQAATYAFQNFSPKTAIILYENTKDDTTFAYHYRQQYLKLGGKIKLYKKISSSQTSATAAIFNNLNLKDAGHMAVFSEKMIAAMNTVSLLESRASKLPLVTYDKWLNINQITLRQFDDLEVYFISPKYINAESQGMQWFRKNYTSKYNMPPSVYANAGFEMVYFFGKMLQEYGTGLNQNLAVAGIRPGVLYQGVGFADPGVRNELRHDNQYLPITKLENLQLTVVNPVYY